MRWISALIFLTSFPLFAGEASKAVLSVLEELKSENRQPGIPENVAISGFVGPQTKTMLNNAWNRRAEWIKGEKVELIEGFEKIEEDLAAVLIGARSTDNPEEVEMMAFGARLIDGRWKMGPTEGRFDSMGLGYQKKLRNRIKDLERWMAIERVSATDRLKEQARKRFMERMTKLVDAKLLKTASPREVMENFLAAAEDGRTDELLIWQGILERKDHDEIPWDDVIRMTRRGMKNQDERNVWRLLNKPGTMRVLLEGEEDEEEKSMLVSFLSGFTTGWDDKKLRPVIFRIRKSPAGWRVVLPSYFAMADKDIWTHREGHRREVHFRDEVNTERMASAFEEEHSPKRAATPEKLLDEIATDLFEGTIEDTLLYLYRDPPEEEVEPEPNEEEAEPEEEIEEGEEDVADPDEVLIPDDEVDPELEKVSRYRETAVWWTKVTGNRKGIVIGNKKIFRSGDLALGVLETLPDNGDWKPEYHSIWLSKDEEGWMIVPGFKKPLPGLLPDEIEKGAGKLFLSLNKHTKTMEKSYLDSLFGRISKMSEEATPVSGEVALKLAKEWRKLVVGGDIPKILAKSAVQKLPESPDEILSNLTFRVKGAAVAEVPDRILGDHAEGRLRGISLMVDGGRGITMNCPLLIVVPTNKGPRLLIDTELYLGNNKGKRRRNEQELERLEKEMNKEDFQSLKKLVAWNEKISRPVWDEWDRAPKAQQGE